MWKKEVLILDDEENELILPKAEQIPNDFYRKGDTIKAIVKSVEMNNNQPRIILFRVRPTSSSNGCSNRRFPRSSTA